MGDGRSRLVAFIHCAHSSRAAGPTWVDDDNDVIQIMNRATMQGLEDFFQHNFVSIYGL